MKRKWIVVVVPILISLACIFPISLNASDTEQIMCTPPACADDETYHCPGECPGGCGTICATRTPLSPTDTAIPVCMPNCGEDAEPVCYGQCPPDCYQCATHTPEVMCTPPACAGNESYYCPGECPGGCGTVCATHTPALTWWQPGSGLTFHIQYTGELDLDHPVDVYNIDLMDTSRETIEHLQQRGVRVICYFSAGTFEDWRFDAQLFPDTIIGNPVEGWPGEYWIDVSNVAEATTAAERRLDIAANLGCDAVDPDNMDGYLQDTGFDITATDQLLFNVWLAREAHRRGLAIGLKNDLEQIPDLVELFDFAVNEECYTYQECDLLMPFIQRGKPVFGIEYELPLDRFCPQANAAGFSFVRKNYDLDAGAVNCWEQ